MTNGSWSRERQVNGLAGESVAWRRIPIATQRRAKAVLLRLKLLAEGPAAGVLANLGKGSKQEDTPPPPTDSLFEQFLPRFASATSEEGLVKEMARAEVEILKFLGQDQAERVLPTDEDKAAELVVREYEGISPVEVTRRLTGSRPGGVTSQRITVAWVEKMRRLNRRDPETGKRLPGWRGWSEAERLEQIERAVAKGWSIRKTADAFGVSKTQLHRDHGHRWAA